MIVCAGILSCHADLRIVVKPAIDGMLQNYGKQVTEYSSKKQLKVLSLIFVGGNRPKMCLTKTKSFKLVLTSEKLSHEAIFLFHRHEGETFVVSPKICKRVHKHNCNVRYLPTAYSKLFLSLYSTAKNVMHSVI